MTPFSSPWQEAFIASLAAIFLLALHNSESHCRGCLRRCKNAESRVAAPRAGIPTRLRGRTPYGLRRRSPGTGNTTIWRGETLASLRAGTWSAVIPSRTQTASVALSASLAPPFFNHPCWDVDSCTLSSACYTHRFVPGDRGSSHPVFSADTFPSLDCRLSKQLEFQSVTKKSTT